MSRKNTAAILVLMSLAGAAQAVELSDILLLNRENVRRDFEGCLNVTAAIAAAPTWLDGRAVKQEAGADARLPYTSEKIFSDERAVLERRELRSSNPGVKVPGVVMSFEEGTTFMGVPVDGLRFMTDRTEHFVYLTSPLSPRDVAAALGGAVADTGVSSAAYPAEGKTMFGCLEKNGGGVEAGVTAYEPRVVVMPLSPYGRRQDDI